MTVVILKKFGDEVQLKSAMDDKLLEYLRMLEKARFDRETKAWYIHESEIEEFIEFIEARGFEVTRFN